MVFSALQKKMGINLGLEGPELRLPPQLNLIIQRVQL